MSYKIELHVRGRINTSPSVTIPVDMLDYIDYVSYYVTATNQETQFVTKIENAEDALGFVDSLQKAAAWSDAPKQTTDNAGIIDLVKSIGVNTPQEATKLFLVDDTVLVEGELTKESLDSAIKKAVNPSHYKNYIEQMQWLDAMSKIPTLRDPEKFSAALELQIRKYLDRNGGKDKTVQELRKAMFYLAYWVCYLENGNQAVPATEVHNRLKAL